MAHCRVGVDQGELVDVEAVVRQTKAEMAQKLTSALLGLSASGNSGALFDGPPIADGAASAKAGGSAPGNGGGLSADYEAVWVETPECTACDECVAIAPGVFKYNDDKKIIIVNPRGAPYRDIVKSAEKCTAECIHPGTPWNMGEKDVAKLMKRAEKFR